MRTVGMLLLGLAIASGASGAVATTGLHGVVRRGPIAPVCRAEQPCDEPAARAVLVFSRNGRDVRTMTRADGSYRVSLDAGVYAVRAGRRRPEPPTVVVRQGRMSRVDFSIDTGIR